MYCAKPPDRYACAVDISNISYFFAYKQILIIEESIILKV